MSGIEEKLAAIEAAAAQQTVSDEDTNAVLEGKLDAEQLEEMTVKELTALAADMGLEVKRNIKKADLIELITATPVSAPAEAIVQKTENQTADEDVQQEPESTYDEEAAQHVTLKGRVLVTYTGMVNMRDENLKVIGHAMQGQTFAVCGRRTDETGDWYIARKQNGDMFFISTRVCKYIT